jgi:hypothetical protein
MRNATDHLEGADASIQSGDAPSTATKICALPASSP